MKWKKLGQIFETDNFAQSPQALVLKDRIRIYYSTRINDNGKFLSQIHYVDMVKDLSKIIGRSSKAVVPLGELGSFDEHGIFPFSVFQEEEKISAYTCGWSRRKSVSVETSTGYAVSNDGGISFQKLGHGPIFGASLHEPFLVGDSFVRKYDDKYHMWYMYGVRWVKENENAAPDRVYKLAHAISDDGLNWLPSERDIISSLLHENECQALPTVIKIGDTYHMYFCFRDVFGFRTDKSKAYRLGYAYSKDLINWTRDDQAGGMDVSAEGWDSDMLCYPNIYEADGRIYLLYNGNAFGKSGFGAAVLDGVP